MFPQISGRKLDLMKDLIRRNRIFLYLSVVPVIFTLWYLFRPEALFVNRSVSETAIAASSSRPLTSGTFSGISHQTAGKAQILDADGKKVLRLSEFSTSNGPDVHVYLVKGASGSDSDAINKGNFVDLGVIKGNIGDQNYVLPATVDVAQINGVSIWCKRFGVNFGAADLQ